jgi:hypothetical protein
MENARGFWFVMFILGLVQIPLGGLFRTEVIWTPPGAAQVTNEVPFSETVTATHWLMGYVRGRQPDVPKVLSKYIREGEQVTELSVTTRHSWVDNLLAGVTLFIYSPVTIELHGKIGRVVAADDRASPRVLRSAGR